jgi:hypothetical protein
MTITAKIIADSVSIYGKRITTMQLRYPRFIHAEELTHRVIYTEPGVYFEEVVLPDGVMYDKNLSRNASSSRAIPVERLIQDILDDTAMPIHWGANQKGMQADEENNAKVTVDGVSMWNHAAWLESRDSQIKYARAFSEAGYHKQIVNRLLEPFSHINVVVTATEWSNFFALRDHEKAQPEIRELAVKMKQAMEESIPVLLLQPGEWHLPYVSTAELEENGLEVATKLSVARCASVSYKTVDGQLMTIERAVDLYDKLFADSPIHASPAEHQATPDDKKTDLGNNLIWKNSSLHGNFTGWIQYRKTLPNENVTSDNVEVT